MCVRACELYCNMGDTAERIGLHSVWLQPKQNKLLITHMTLLHGIAALAHRTGNTANYEYILWTMDISLWSIVPHYTVFYINIFHKLWQKYFGCKITVCNCMVEVIWAGVDRVESSSFINMMNADQTPRALRYMCWPLVSGGLLIHYLLTKAAPPSIQPYSIIWWNTPKHTTHCIRHHHRTHRIQHDTLSYYLLIEQSSCGRMHLLLTETSCQIEK